MFVRTRMGGMISGGLWALVLAAGVLSAHSAQAVPLNLVPGRPDFLTTNLALQYTAATDTLLGGGRVQTLTLPGGAVLDVEGAPLPFGNLTFTATIDGLGTATAATLTITGEVPALGASGTLLQGALAPGGFGLAAAPALSGVLEFIFTTNPASVLAGQFGPKFQMILNTGGTQLNTASFAGNFTTMALGAADVTAVPTPEPLSAGLAGTALVLVGWAALRRRTARVS